MHNTIPPISLTILLFFHSDSIQAQTCKGSIIFHSVKFLNTHKDSHLHKSSREPRHYITKTTGNTEISAEMTSHIALH